MKIPATAEGVPAIRQMISEGRSINVTLIFSLDRYNDVMEAYLQGLEAYEGDLSKVHSVGSFFISRVDTEVDRRLDEIGTPEALALKGKAAIAQGKLAYQEFLQAFSGKRWDALVERGAQVQRPLWASTSTKNPAYPDTLYVDNLIGPDTVNTLPDKTIADFNDHGTRGPHGRRRGRRGQGDVAGPPRRGRRHGRRGPRARAGGRGLVPEELRRAARLGAHTQPDSAGANGSRCRNCVARAIREITRFLLAIVAVDHLLCLAADRVDHAPAIEVKPFGVGVGDELSGILLAPFGEVRGHSLPVLEIRVDHPVDQLAHLPLYLLRRISHDLALEGLLHATAVQ